MVIGFILINCDSNYLDYVMGKLKEIKGVSEICNVFGSFDFIVKVKAENIEMFTEIISFKIRRISKLKSTLMLIGANPDGEFL